MLSDSHKNCVSIEDQMAEEIHRLEKVIKAYRGMLTAMNMAPTVLDDIEDEAYNS